MADRITANLPSRNFTATSAFYKRLGFAEVFRSDAWMILRRDGLEVEFFPHPTLKPAQSWFSACLRLDDIDCQLTEWQKLDLPDDPKAIPRLTGVVTLPNTPRMFALIDPDGSLWRCLENGGD